MAAPYETAPYFVGRASGSQSSRRLAFAKFINLCS